MQDAKSQFWRALVAVAAAALLTACSSFGVRSPSNGQTFTAPVTVTLEVAWTPANQMQNLKVVLENTSATPPTSTDITSGFTVTPSNATRNMMLPIGKYRVTATGTVYDSLYRQNIPHTYAVGFDVLGTAGLTINAQPTLTLPPASSASVLVTATRTGVAATSPEPIVLTADQLPSHITATGSTIPATANSGSVTFTASTFAGPATPSRIKGASNSSVGAIDSTSNLALRVSRGSGNFVLAPIQAVNAGATAASPNGRAQLSIVANAPGYAAAQVARYTQIGSQRVLMDLGFNMGVLLSANNSYGGAGFCPGSSAGFAISGVNPNRGVVAATDFVVFAGRLDDNSRQTARQEVWGVRPPPLGQAATYAFAPQVWFNADCLVMMVISAQSSQSGTEKHLASFYDFSNRSPICALPFDQLPSAPGFIARVVAGQTKDTIELLADGNTKACDVP